MEKYDFLIVGAGFSGSVLAERIAIILKKKVLLVDCRDHIGGNAYDYVDEFGILVHKYGPHIFHTNDKKVFDYLSNFTDWIKYEHKVLANHNGSLYPIPINANTLYLLYGKSFKQENEVKAFLDKIRLNIYPVKNSEDIVLNQLGPELYKIFFEKFTLKTWFRHPKELSPAVCGRIKVRFNEDDRYFLDKYQFMPQNGYNSMFNNMVDNARIKILLNTDYKDVINKVKYKTLIYTGPLDYYFDECYGKLQYRSLRIDFKNIKREYYQSNSVINFVGSEKHTRITEFKYLTNQKSKTTTIGIEYPIQDGEKYYPTLTSESITLFNKYNKLTKGLHNVIFTGRLANFKYYNMDQVIANSQMVFNKIKNENII